MKTESSKTTILPDGSAFFTMGISISWQRNMLKKLKMLDWWLCRPRYYCPLCKKGLYTYWDGNDVKNVGIDLCNKCANDSKG